MAGEPQDADLPKALIKRIVKNKLSEADGKDYQINKDALLAFGEAGKLFIHYLTATANDVCKEAKRQTISADDVVTALADIEFPELIEPLKQALESYRQDLKEKNKKKAEASKKRKADKSIETPSDKLKAAAAAQQREEEDEEQKEVKV